jgi:hypothetical protein
MMQNVNCQTKVVSTYHWQLGVFALHCGVSLPQNLSCIQSFAIVKVVLLPIVIYFIFIND